MYNNNTTHTNEARCVYADGLMNEPGWVFFIDRLKSTILLVRFGAVVDIDQEETGNDQ